MCGYCRSEVVLISIHKTRQLLFKCGERSWMSGGWNTFAPWLRRSSAACRYRIAQDHRVGALQSCRVGGTGAKRKY